MGYVRFSLNIVKLLQNPHKIAGNYLNLRFSQKPGKISSVLLQYLYVFLNSLKIKNSRI